MAPGETQEIQTTAGEHPTAYARGPAKDYFGPNFSFGPLGKYNRDESIVPGSYEFPAAEGKIVPRTTYADYLQQK